jgi:hemoglobin-like flavoprotein
VHVSPRPHPHHRLFQIEPKTLGPLGFNTADNVSSHPSFPLLARIMVDMVDLSVGFLGPDLDPLNDDLVALGQRHINYGAEPEYFASMGVALVCSLAHILPDFTAKEEDAWVSVFQFMISRMSYGLRQAQRERDNGKRRMA